MIKQATPTNEIEPWLRSAKPALIDGHSLRPLEHGRLAGTPLSVQCGQAQAFFLRSDNGQTLILKKFLPGRSPDADYLRAIRGVLPHHAGLRGGTERVVLTTGLMHKRFGYYRSKSLDQWLDGTVLMPRIPGDAWASVADDLRAGDIALDAEQRMTLVRSLADLVQTLESAGCAHRDISSGNAFVDGKTGRVSLIDFDGVYHARLNMPTATAAGTEGYLAPFVWNGGAPQVSPTWCAHADRFALALLCVEILVMDRGAPLSADGGLFDQQELCARRGATIDYAFDRLQSAAPEAGGLLATALQSRDFCQCPAPTDWLGLRAHCPTPLPQLADLETVVMDDLARQLRRTSDANGVVAAPLLSELPDVHFSLPNYRVGVVQKIPG